MKFKASGNYGARNANQSPKPVRAVDTFHSGHDANKISPESGGTSEQRTGGKINMKKLLSLRSEKKIKRLAAIRRGGE